MQQRTGREQELLDQLKKLEAEKREMTDKLAALQVRPRIQAVITQRMKVQCANKLDGALFCDCTFQDVQGNKCTFNMSHGQSIGFMSV